MGLRALLGYDRVVAARVVSAFVNELIRSLKKRAKTALGVRSMSDVHTGWVLAVQRTDAALTVKRPEMTRTPSTGWPRALM